jgi:hypothetical protein
MRYAIGLALLLSGCAALLGPEMVPEAKGEYKATGEVSLLDQNATFDAVRVRNARWNLSKRVDGSWGGTVVDPGNATQAIDVSVTPKSIRGVNLVLTLESQDDQNTVIVGQFQGRIVRFELHPDVVDIRTESQSYTFHKLSDGVYGPKGQFVLKGDANKTPHPWPQIAFALLAAFD